MKTILRSELIALGGAPDARFVIFREDGSLYFCTSAGSAANDEDYWKSQGMTLKSVIDFGDQA